MESLKETYDTAKTQLMFKDGQIEQLEVRDDISVLTHIPAPALPLQHRSSSTLEVDLTIALQVAIDDCKIDWQRLNTRFMQRESDVLTAEKAKVRQISHLGTLRISDLAQCNKVFCSGRLRHWSSACYTSRTQRMLEQDCKFKRGRLQTSIIVAVS